MFPMEPRALVAMILERFSGSNLETIREELWGTETATGKALKSQRAY